MPCLVSADKRSKNIVMTLAVYISACKRNENANQNATASVDQYLCSGSWNGNAIIVKLKSASLATFAQ